MQETWVWSLGLEDSLEKEMVTLIPVFLPGKSHGQRSLVGYRLRGLKELDTTQWLNSNRQLLQSVVFFCFFVFLFFFNAVVSRLCSCHYRITVSGETWKEMLCDCNRLSCSPVGMGYFCLLQLHHQRAGQNKQGFLFGKLRSPGVTVWDMVS